MTAPICPEKSDNSYQQIKDKRKLLRLGMEYPLEKIDNKGIEQDSQIIHHHHKRQSQCGLLRQCGLRGLVIKHRLDNAIP